jgi:F-type H+-transporting ATPase subunit b
VWLLKRVLYKPIMTAIEARETLVAAELADAAQKKATADKALAEFKSKNESFDRDRAGLWAKVSQEAKAQGAGLLEAARVAADTLQSKRRDALQHEVADLSESMRHHAQQAFFSLARRAFKDLANGSLEEQMVALFCERLRAMKNEDKDKLGAAIQATPGLLSVRSAFALPPNSRKTIQDALNETFQGQIALRFEIKTELLGGIELTAPGQRLGWSLAEYLAALERDSNSVLPAAVPTSLPSPPANQSASAPPAALLAVT